MRLREAKEGGERMRGREEEREGGMEGGGGEERRRNGGRKLGIGHFS